MMAVDFCDYFWGEKHDGFNVIYQVMHLVQTFASGMEWLLESSLSQNMKAGLVAARDLTDVARETALMQENSAKVYMRMNQIFTQILLHPNPSQKFRCTLESASNWGRTPRLGASNPCWPPSRRQLKSWLPFTRRLSPR